ncbi:MAG: HAD family hydrolase [Verrucomicrobiota bacterium]|nr:HAD family hydrolase [Verrucomicrobiota bacterium]
MSDCRKAVFLDRDGTLNMEKSYLSDPDQLVLFPEVIPALKKLQEARYLLFIVTNQSGIGRGYYTEADMHRVNERLLTQVKSAGVHFSQIYFSPESPDIPSRGRKPSPQFLHDAARDFNITLADSYMVGDKLSDIECGWNAGVKASILVRTGYGRETEEGLDHCRDDLSVVDDLLAGADWILGQGHP